MATKQCEAVYEYYDDNTGICSLCIDVCNEVVWQVDVCSTHCAGLYSTILTLFRRF